VQTCALTIYLKHNIRNIKRKTKFSIYRRLSGLENIRTVFIRIEGGLNISLFQYKQRLIAQFQPALGNNMEIDRMNAMLEAWGQQPVTDSGGMGTIDEMGGMDHGEMGGMSGMMSQEDMTALEEAQGTEAARLYLEQMTAHHEGAVDMARDEVADGQNPHAITLAEQIINDQEAEIAQMQQMLTDL